MGGYRGRRLAATAATCLLFSGCPSSSSTLDDGSDPLSAVSLQRSMAVVTPDGSDQALALGAVVRVTQDEVVLLAAPRRGGAEALEADHQLHFRIGLPGERGVPARLLGSDGSCLVLACSRGEHDVRPLELSAATPIVGTPTQLVPAPRPPLPSLEPTRTAIAAAPAGSAPDTATVFLSHAPRLGELDDRSDSERARAADGGILLDARGRLLGLVVGHEGDQPRVALAAATVAKLEPAILEPGGADRVGPRDGFLEYICRVDSLANLPRCEKEEDSEPLLALEVRIAGELAGKIEVTPGRPLLPARVCAKANGPVEVLLVALDRSLAKGETREELSKPCVLLGLQRQLAARLELSPLALERHPMAAGGPTVIHALLAFEPVDPDRDDGPRRTPLGAAPVSLGRLYESAVDLPAGRATEFLTVDSDEPQPIGALVYRRRLGARLAFTGFAPGFDESVVALETADDGPRITAAIGRLRRGRTLLRVRQTQGESGTAYELLLATREASAVVSPLFRLVSREATREGTAFLDSDEFVEDVARALSALDLGKEKVAAAILDELGSRVCATRRLALLLLERHFPPPPGVIAERFAQGASGGLPAPGDLGAQDAGLILAEMNPKDRALWPLLRRIARDDDAYVRARALRVAARSDDPAFAEELIALLVNDTTPIVERALAGARIAAAKRRAETEARTPH